MPAKSQRPTAARDMHTRQNGQHPPQPIDPDQLLTDTYNARAFVRNHGQDVRYCYPWKSWLVWTGTHWQRDESGEVMRRAKQTIKHLVEGITDVDDTAAIALLKHVKSSLATAKLKAMLENAQSEEDIPLQSQDLDSHPWLLNCANGTLDLQTGTLHEHIRTHLLTKCVPIPLDPDATCPTWERFLWRIMGGTVEPDDPDLSVGELENRQQADARAQRLMTFLQRALGYSLTGSTR